MLHGIRRRLSFANVTSMLALTIALGGTSYAAATLPKNSVTGAQIKQGAIGGGDIHANAVTSPKVKNGSLKAVDFRAGQLPAGAKGDTGARGPAGAKGETGATGTTGTTGVATVQTLLAPADLADGVKMSYGVTCPAGQQAIGGGGRGDDQNSELTSVTSSRPQHSAVDTEPPPAGSSFTGWRITVINPLGGAAVSIRPQVWVVCVSAP